MKNNSKIKTEQNRKETVCVMETVLFANLTEQKIKSKSPLCYYDLLDFLAIENNVNARFTPFFMFGNVNEISKATDLLIRSAKEN
jgi:hypothetical protein